MSAEAPASMVDNEGFLVIPINTELLDKDTQDWITQESQDQIDQKISLMEAEADTQRYESMAMPALKPETEAKVEAAADPLVYYNGKFIRESEMSRAKEEPEVQSDYKGKHRLEDAQVAVFKDEKPQTAEVIPLTRRQKLFRAAAGLVLAATVAGITSAPAKEAPDFPIETVGYAISSSANSAKTAPSSHIAAKEFLAKGGASVGPEANASSVEAVSKPAGGAPAPEAVIKPADLRERVDRVVYFNQTDPDWRRVKYGSGGGHMGFNGCGPATMAMVLSTMTDKKFTPVDVANYNMERGYVTRGGATTHKSFYDTPKQFGLEANRVPETVEAVKEVTDRGGMVIVNGTDGIKGTPATSGGHVYAIRGVTPDNKLLIVDPASRPNSQKAWEPSTIFGPASIAVAVHKPSVPAEQPKPKPEQAPAPMLPAPQPLQLAQPARPKLEVLAQAAPFQNMAFGVGGSRPDAQNPNAGRAFDSLAEKVKATQEPAKPAPQPQPAAANKNPYPVNTMKWALVEAGWPEAELTEATATFMAESEGNAKAFNGKDKDESYGIAQVNMKGRDGVIRMKKFALKTKEALYDPITNLKVARAIKVARGSWKDWGAYTNDSYKKWYKPGFNPPLKNVPNKKQ